MTVFELLRQFLLADPAIEAVVSARVYPVLVPQSPTYPLIRIQLISDPSDDHLRGTGPGRPRFQIEAITRKSDGASAFEAAQALGELVRARLDAYAGEWTDEDASPPVSYRIWVQRQGAVWLFDPDVNGGFFRHVSDWFVQHQGKISA